MTEEPRISGAWLFAQECHFMAGATTPLVLPQNSIPEIAFAGRSNVGKSSLLNALTNRKTLARVSHRPGRTQQINFFDLAGCLVLVDLPGHGYAEVSKATKRQWSALIESYIKGRPNLRRLLLLIDSRHGYKDADLKLMDLLDKAALSYQVVMTKADEVKPAALEENHRLFLATIAKRPAAYPAIAITSARTGAGIAELREALAAFAETA